MIFDLSNESGVSNANERLKWLASRKATIELTEKKGRRSIDQNSYLHLIITWYAINIGLTREEAKHEYKMISKDIYVYEKKGRKFIKSSADLDTKEMSTSIDRFRNHSSVNAGVYLPDPNEQEFLNHIRNEAIACQQYL